MGQDPLDRAQLDFVDPARDIRVVPTMAILMAYPGFWIGDPACGVDGASVLHADQSLEIYHSLPSSGLVISETSVSDVVDKGPGRPALIRTETTLRDASGLALARHDRTIFVKGGGGFGGEGGQRRPTAARPSGPPDDIVSLVTRPEQALFYRLNGDTNPLHADPDYAARAGYDRPILHGLCTAGLACHAVLRSVCSYDERRLRRLGMAFVGVTFPGETVAVEIWREGFFRVRVPARDALVIDHGFYVTD